LEVLAFSNSTLTAQQIYDAATSAAGWTQDQRAVRGLFLGRCFVVIRPRSNSELFRTSLEFHASATKTFKHMQTLVLFGCRKVKEGVV